MTCNVTCDSWNCRLTVSISVLCFMFVQPCTTARSEPPGVDRSRADETAEWSWKTSDASVALVRGQNVIWQFDYGDDLDVPYFHPLATTDGRVLSWNRPPDHVWHHGLWFCWKYINGVNYWELNPATGKPDGRTAWSDVRVDPRDDHSAQISMTLSYRPADGGETVLDERRRIAISAPDEAGVYRIDWTSTFKALAGKVILDRTPPQEQAWGGYAGLSVRFAQNLTERQAISTFGPAEFGEGDRHRSHGPAMDYSGLIDGQAVGLAFLDHPRNPRHPTPWYLIRSSAMGYINAALLSDEPMTLENGEAITLRYRLIVHPGRWDTERLQAAYLSYQ